MATPSSKPSGLKRRLRVYHVVGNSSVSPMEHRELGFLCLPKKRQKTACVGIVCLIFFWNTLKIDDNDDDDDNDDNNHNNNNNNKKSLRKAERQKSTRSFLDAGGKPQWTKTFVGGWATLLWTIFGYNFQTKISETTLRILGPSNARALD